MDLLSLSGLVIGVLGTTFGAYGIWQARYAAPRLRYDIRRTAVAQPGQGDHVGITFDGRPVPRVNQLTVGFVNGGGQRINQADLERPVVLRFAEEDTHVLRITGDADEIAERAIELRICPMAPGERRTATVHHTGPVDVEVSVTGEVANLPRGLERSSPKQWEWILPTIMGVLVIGGWVAYASMIITDDDIEHWNAALRVGWAILAPPLFVVVCTLPLVVFAWVAPYARRVLRRRAVFPD